MSKVVWFASGGHVARSGPYETQVEAAKTLMVHAENCATKIWPRTDLCDCKLRPVENAFVWPEEQREEVTERNRRESILNAISAAVSDFLYYDRKEDEDLPRGAIEEAVAAGEITIDEIVAKFKEYLGDLK